MPLPHYERWTSMKQRCYNPKNTNYKNYGGRGITICEEWHNFEPFYIWCLERYKPGLTIDRIDNDKGYSPENCRFTTHLVQATNKRPRSPVLISKRGDPQTRTEKICGTCKVKKKLDMFNKNSGSKDLHTNKCKACNSAFNARVFNYLNVPQKQPNVVGIAPQTLVKHTDKSRNEGFRDALLFLRKEWERLNNE